MTSVSELPTHAGAVRPATALLSVRDLTVLAKSRDRVRTLVRDVGFEMHPGETLGLVGESGSGKSMTARSIIGLLPQNVEARGSVRFDGASIIGAQEKALRKIRGSRMSMVLQDPFTMLNPLQTVREHLLESLAPSIRRDRRRRQTEIARRLSEVGLDAKHVGDRHPFQLSGGMRQRVALAAALARDPELLIADEPTTALDVTTQDEILGLLKDLQRTRGMALLLITHDLRVAFSVSHRVLVMYAGSIIEEAPAVQVAVAPEHPYTLGLMLAEPPVSHRVEQLVAIPGNVPAPDDVADRCAFAARCSWQAEKCIAARPVLAKVGANHRSACIRLEDIRDQLRPPRVHSAVPGPAAPLRPTDEPLLRFENVSKTFHTKGLIGRPRTTVAAEDVSFEIGAGESIGLVGETGSGKTTLARCLLGLVRPDSGTISLAGTDISDYRRLSRSEYRRVRRLVQIVFQDPYASLNPSLQIGTALREALRTGGTVDAYDAEIAALLADVGLPPAYARRRPAALSGGERQRVAIARAIGVRPQLLVCDEPVASLDVSVQAQILQLLRKVRTEHKISMLFITHDLAVVRQMTERVIVLYHGKIVEHGLTTTVLDEPRDPYTIRLLASLPDPPRGRKGPFTALSSGGQPEREDRQV